MTGSFYSAQCFGVSLCHWAQWPCLWLSSHSVWGPLYLFVPPEGERATALRCLPAWPPLHTSTFCDPASSHWGSACPGRTGKRERAHKGKGARAWTSSWLTHCAGGEPARQWGSDQWQNLRRMWAKQDLIGRISLKRTGTRAAPGVP